MDPLTMTNLRLAQAEKCLARFICNYTHQNSKNIHNNYRVKLPLTSWFLHGFTGYLYIIPRFSICGNIQFLERTDGYSDRVDVLNSQIFHISTGHVSWRNGSPFSIFVSAALPPGLPSTPPLRWPPPGGTMGSIKNNGEVMGNWHGKWWCIMAELWFNQKLEHKEGKWWFTYGSTMIS